MKRSLIVAVIALVTLVASLVSLRGQGGRIPSPAGTASTEVRGTYVDTPDEPVYRGGKWIEITSGRPIKRGRELWGSGADYGKRMYAGAPVWRAGADESTRLKTEVPLVIGGKTVPPGEYSLFIDLKPGNWTFIVSTWKASEEFPSRDKDALFGAFDYTPAKDVVRTPMKLETLPHSVDQLTWKFLDMNNDGGTIAIEWDKVMATVPFKIP